MTLDRSKVWTGDLNAKALEPQPRVTVGLLRHHPARWRTRVGVVLVPEQKVEIAKALAAAGVDRIEAGFPRVSADDAQGDLAHPRGRPRRRDLGLLPRGAGGCGGARRARPASVGDREPDLRTESWPRSASRARPCSSGSLRAVSFAAAEGIKVAFFGVDSTRADLEFVRQVYETAVEAGAQEVAVVDTLGIATPEAAAFLVTEVVERLNYEIPVHWHGHDDFGLATAAAVAAVQAGATWVQGTVNGMGERAGNVDLVEIALAVEALYGIPTRLRLDHARTLRPSCRSCPERRSRPGSPSRATTSSRASRVRCPAVPRPAGHRALLIRARRRRARHRARQEERDRLDPDQGGRSRARRAGGPLPALLEAVERARGRRSEVLSPTQSSGGSLGEEQQVHHRELVNPPELHPAPGFSHIAIASGSKVVHFAGQVALAADFSIVGGDDLYEQTRAAMQNVKVAMAAAGVGWDDIVRRTIYTVHPTEYETITRAIDSVTGGADHPAQTILGVTGLAVPGLLVEIECTAVLPG